MLRPFLRLIGLILIVQMPVMIVQMPVVRGQGVPAKVGLTVQVSSVEEGPMEGVLVSAKHDGSTVTITVVSDQQGRYDFPSTRTGSGRYTLNIRAVSMSLMNRRRWTSTLKARHHRPQAQKDEQSCLAADRF